MSIRPGTKLAELHRASTIRERTNCSYGLSPDYQHIASEGGLVVSAIDDTGEVRAIERPEHPFFVGTLYQPQRSSEPGGSHPVLDALVRAAAVTAKSVSGSLQ